jgi:threonylcarbamoyladenosine tRNA methylthiotransferase MtaB
MGRPYAAESYFGIVERLRASMPDIAVTSDVLVGFPSEDEDDFAATLEVCRRAEFAKVHVFRYSRRPGTPAAARVDQVPAEDMKQRSQTLREVAADMRESYINDRLGTVAEVLVEEASSGTESPGCVGTSREYIRVHVPGTALEPGRIIDARLLRREGDVAVGEVAGER